MELSTWGVGEGGGGTSLLGVLEGGGGVMFGGVVMVVVVMVMGEKIIQPNKSFQNKYLPQIIIILKIKSQIFFSIYKSIKHTHKHTHTHKKKTSPSPPTHLQVVWVHECDPQGGPQDAPCIAHQRGDGGVSLQA
jgi:hypothetical protein